MTFSFCMSPISSGKDSSLLECRNSTVAFFQLPICEGVKEKHGAVSWRSWLARYRWAGLTRHAIYLHKHKRMCHAHLGGKLRKEVVISGEGADAGTLADGRRQRFDLVETAVQLIQRRQPDAEKSRIKSCDVITINRIKGWNDCKKGSESLSWSRIDVLQRQS